MLEYTNGWELLKNNCGEYEDELTINELNKFMKKYKTFVGLDCVNNSIDDIRHTLVDAYGITCIKEEYRI